MLHKKHNYNDEVDIYLTKNRVKIIIISLLTAVIVFSFFLPSLENGFVNWDDNNFVYGNKQIQTIDKDFWTWIFGFHYGNWCPLVWLSHALDCILWNMTPSGHHLTSIIFHAINTFLFTILVIELLKIKKSVSFMMPDKGSKQFFIISVIAGTTAGLFFGLSPLRVESVVWISERRDVLFLFFGLLSIIFYLKYYKSIKNQSENLKGRITFYLLSLIFFSAGLMSKSMIVTLPFILLLIDWYPLERFSPEKQRLRWQFVLLEKTPFFLLSIVLAIITYTAQSSANAVYGLVHMPMLVRVLISFKACTFYLIKSIFPKDLAPLYLIKETNLNVFSYQYLVPIIILIIITAFCFIVAKRTRLFLVVWSFYLLTLLPVIGFVQVGNQFAADRYTYLPGLGIALLFGLGVGMIYKMIMTLNKARIAMLVLLPVSVICFFGMNVFFLQKQIAVWKDSISLWNREIKLYPDIIAVPYKNRGVALFNAGMFKDAIRDFNTAIKLRPDDHTTHVNIALSFQKIGDRQNALNSFKTAARLGDMSVQKYLTSKGVKW